MNELFLLKKSDIWIYCTEIKNIPTEIVMMFCQHIFGELLFSDIC